jgi:anthranilate phosphoribosyltransferase
MSEIKKYIEKISNHENLSQDEAGRVFQIILNGGATPAQIAATLMGLRLKGETIEEISGAAHAMRVKMQKLPIAPDFSTKIIDTCGTGGDKKGTYNISTAVAFVVAGAGVPVAKHGNRAISSRSGSADVLQALGVNIEAKPEISAEALQQAGVCFMLAPHYHKNLINVSPVRQELGIKTIFNILGPICNPAQPEMQVVGVFDKSLTVKIAEVLKNLGTKSAMIVHGDDGMDEITICGKTYVAELKDGFITEYEIHPEDFGFEIPSPEMLEGGEGVDNAAELRKLLDGSAGAYRDIVCLNAAAALKVAGKVKDLQHGINLAKASIDSGDAKAKLAKLVEVSNG